MANVSVQVLNTTDGFELEAEFRVNKLRTLKSSQCNFATEGNGGLVHIEAERLIGKKPSKA
ncbi:hypothetical protein H4J38_06405 [Colwellia sp. BRX10-3]|uniref:hypothetical protein n=1 Tax=Colwellia sp. BRX10-3 TaxID=2759844 RepID=UPI0015F41EC1|nr:hypothetical protein [Colwellia sp. BRX10-3]MBA6390417.1 hypothetical protein [Colwellia sp. BRX10-3]